MKTRTFAQVALCIQAAWRNISPAAQVYLDALKSIRSTDPHEKYMLEDAEGITRYFLSSAGSFRGPEARALKAELKQMINMK